MKRDVYIGVGSNVGDPVSQCREAGVRLCGSKEVDFICCSSLYRTEPIGYSMQDWFVNAVFHLRTELEPHDLLRLLQGIEREMGKRVPFRWGPRVIDLDILLYGDLVVRKDGVHIPHPRMHLRRFVLQPLLEIVPNAEHPILKKTIAQLLSQLGSKQRAERIEKPADTFLVKVKGAGPAAPFRESIFNNNRI